MPSDDTPAKDGQVWRNAHKQSPVQPSARGNNELAGKFVYTDDSKHPFLEFLAQVIEPRRLYFSNTHRNTLSSTFAVIPKVLWKKMLIGRAPIPKDKIDLLASKLSVDGDLDENSPGRKEMERLWKAHTNQEEVEPNEDIINTLIAHNCTLDTGTESPSR